MLGLIGNILMFAGALAALLLLVPLAGLATRHVGVLAASERISFVARTIVIAVARGAMWLGLAIALVQLAVVVMRYVFGINFIWLQELVVWMFGLLFLLAAGSALLSDDHVRVDIFYRDMPEKRKAMVNLAGTYLFLFPVAILIVWAAGPYVHRSWEVLEHSREASGLPAVYLLKSAIPLFAVLVALAGYVMAHRAVMVLLGRRQDEETA